MRISCSNVIVGIVGLSFLLLFALPVALFAAAEVPVKGMVTMIDLGAKKCILGKMMAPILEKLEKVYAGKAVVVFPELSAENREKLSLYLAGFSFD